MAKNSQKKLKEILDIANEEILDSGTEVELVTPADVTSAMNEISYAGGAPEDKDYNYAHKVMMEMTEHARKAVEQLILVCAETMHPRSYEVLGQLLKTTTEVAKELVMLRKSKAELNKFKLPGDPQALPSEQPASILDGQQPLQVFHGTTAELLQAIKDAKTSDNKE